MVVPISAATALARRLASRRSSGVRPGDGCGRALTARLLSAGAVDTDPLGGRIQMKKWQEQSWQLAIHVALSIAEGIILTEETWYTVPATCWIPHPFTQRETGWRADLKGVYVMALAIWIYTCIIHRRVSGRVARTVLWATPAARGMPSVGRCVGFGLQSGVRAARPGARLGWVGHGRRRKVRWALCAGRWAQARRGAAGRAPRLF